MREVHEDGVLAEWNAGRVPLLAAHPMAAKYGLNIQHGGHEIVWLSLPWSLEDYDQATPACTGPANPIRCASIGFASPARSIRAF